MSDSFYKQIKAEHFRNLVAIAYADGVLDPEEMDFLADKATEYGVPEEEVNEIMANAHQLQFMVPMNQFDKEEQLSDVVFMSMIDGEVHDKEYALCLSIAEKLDLDKNYLDHIIELTKKLWRQHE